jgi:hypothetical protein
MGQIDIYLRTVEGRIIILKDVGTTNLDLNKLKTLANKHFDPRLNIANIRFLYRGEKLDDSKFNNLLTNTTDKMIFIDILVVEPKVYRDTELNVYMVKNTVAYPTELYPTGHENSPFLRVKSVEYKPEPLSLSSIDHNMKRVDADIDNLLRMANGEQIPNKKIGIKFQEYMRPKELPGGSRKAKRRNKRKSRRMKLSDGHK